MNSLLRIESWKSGWSSKAMKKYRTMFQIPDTMEGMARVLFKGWKQTLVFRGRNNPKQWQEKMNFKPVSGWSDFYEVKS